MSLQSQSLDAARRGLAADVPPASQASDALADEVAPLVAEITAFMRDTQAEVVGCWRDRAASMETIHVLLTLRSHGPLNISGLAQLRGVSLPNASCIVDRLEERGLVERVRDLNDRRVVEVRLAAQGEALLEVAEEVRRRALTRVLEAMAPAERPGFARAIRAFTAAYRRLVAAGEFHDLVADATASEPLTES